MKPVVQRHAMGCGIACMAFVLNCSYAKALSLLRITKLDASQKGIYCREIVVALEQQGIPANFRYITSRVRRSIYCDGTIVFICRSKRYPTGHYLCRWKGQWMDPWINGPPDWNLSMAKAGFRKRLPGRAVYAVHTRAAKQ